jgi:glyoxylase-like metal-dependent hydrolase (beta-lactamase superfamily II)
MPIKYTVGTATVTALEDGSGTFFQPRQQAFPAATGDDWRHADEFDPGARTADGQWLLRFRCFAIQPAGGAPILVDAGIGPADALAAAWAPVPGRLPEELAAAGIAPDEVSTVVLTHLHTDHIGWAVVTGAGGGREPFFRNARYVLQQAEYDALARFGPKLPGSLIEPLASTGQLHLVDGAVPLGRGVSTVATPGHTPGHQCVLLDTGEDRLLVGGDLLVHALQLVRPAMPYALEADPDAARDCRIRLLDELGAAGGTLATAHLTDAFHRL